MSLHWNAFCSKSSLKRYLRVINATDKINTRRIDLSDVAVINDWFSARDMEAVRDLRLPGAPVSQTPGNPLFTPSAILSFQPTSASGVGPATGGGTLTQLPSPGNDGKSTDRRSDNGYIKRPMNPYMIWSTIHRPIIARENPKSKSSDISILLGNVWRRLSEEQKAPYYEEAQRLKMIHSQQFPDYSYNPRPEKRKASNRKVSPSVARGVSQRPAPSNIPTAPLTDSTSQASATQTSPVRQLLHPSDMDMSGGGAVSVSPDSPSPTGTFSPQFTYVPTVQQDSQGSPLTVYSVYPSGAAHPVDGYGGCSRDYGAFPGPAAQTINPNTSHSTEHQDPSPGLETLEDLLDIFLSGLI